MTKDDLISRQAAIERLREFANDDLASTEKAIGADYCVDLIRTMPSAQPHITHCAECIHWKHSAVRKSYCDVFDWVNEAEDFCSFAERRTNGRD